MQQKQAELGIWEIVKAIFAVLWNIRALLEPFSNFTRTSLVSTPASIIKNQSLLPLLGLFDLEKFIYTGFGIGKIVFLFDKAISTDAIKKLDAEKLEPEIEQARLVAPASASLAETKETLEQVGPEQAVKAEDVKSQLDEEAEFQRKKKEWAVVPYKGKQAEPVQVGPAQAVKVEEPEDSDVFYDPEPEEYFVQEAKNSMMLRWTS